VRFVEISLRAGQRDGVHRALVETAVENRLFGNG
jgi:hypothetical protein